MALDIKGKTALVTGGGSGICLALARKLLAGGCSVMVADRALTPEAKEVIRDHEEGSVKCRYIETDVTDWKQLRKAFEQTMQDFGRLDIIIPGAGILEPAYSNFWHFNTPSTQDTDDASSYKIFETNINHPIRATQLAIDYFKRQKLGYGVVCHISSIAAQLTLLPCPLYCVSKHAISAFVRSMASLEASHNIRINAVAPGIVKTPLWDKEKLGWVDEEVDVWVTREQVADVMVELITKEEFVGGTVLEVGAERVRKVELLNDEGPEGRGHTLARIAGGFVDALELLDGNFGKKDD